jgi:hypothetical protein
VLTQIVKALRRLSLVQISGAADDHEGDGCVSLTAIMSAAMN